jgi:hypothetical protein
MNPSQSGVGLTPTPTVCSVVGGVRKKASWMELARGSARARGFFLIPLSPHLRARTILCAGWSPAEFFPEPKIGPLVVSRKGAFFSPRYYSEDPTLI